MNHKGLPYEQAAEQQTVTGWVCKACHHFWGDNEHMARYCCASSLPCACGERITMSRTCCDKCHQKHRAEVFAKLQTVDWDGETPLCVFDDDTYFFDADALAEWLDDHDYAASDAKLVLCATENPRFWEATEFWHDDLGEDGGDCVDAHAAAEIEKLVNDWATANLPKMWHPTGKRVTSESVAIHTDRPLTRAT